MTDKRLEGQDRDEGGVGRLRGYQDCGHREGTSRAAKSDKESVEKLGGSSRRVCGTEGYWTVGTNITGQAGSKGIVKRRVGGSAGGEGHWGRIHENLGGSRRTGAGFKSVVVKVCAKQGKTVVPTGKKIWGGTEVSALLTRQNTAESSYKRQRGKKQSDVSRQRGVWPSRKEGLRRGSENSEKDDTMQTALNRKSCSTYLEHKNEERALANFTI